MVSFLTVSAFAKIYIVLSGIFVCINLRKIHLRKPNLDLYMLFSYVGIKLKLESHDKLLEEKINPQNYIKIKTPFSS